MGGNTAASVSPIESNRAKDLSEVGQDLCFLERPDESVPSGDKQAAVPQSTHRGAEVPLV